MAELPEAEREAMEAATRVRLRGTGRDRVGEVPSGESVWLAARDYYTGNEDWTVPLGAAADHWKARAGQAEARERALREALEKIKDGVRSEYPLTLGEVEDIVTAALAAGDLQAVPMSDPERETYESELRALRDALKTLANPNPEQHDENPYVRRMADYASAALAASPQLDHPERERDTALAATVEDPGLFVLPELEVVGATELRAGDEMLLRVDQVLQDPKTGRVELVGVESGPRLPEQMCVRVKHSQVGTAQSDHGPGETSDALKRSQDMALEEAIRVLEDADCGGLATSVREVLASRTALGVQEERDD